MQLIRVSDIADVTLVAFRVSRSTMDCTVTESSKVSLCMVSDHIFMYWYGLGLNAR
jgi:hypothetical protein